MRMKRILAPIFSLSVSVSMESAQRRERSRRRMEQAVKAEQNGTLQSTTHLVDKASGSDSEPPCAEQG